MRELRIFVKNVPGTLNCETGCIEDEGSGKNQCEDVMIGVISQAVKVALESILTVSREDFKTVSTEDPKSVVGKMIRDRFGIKE